MRRFPKISHRLALAAMLSTPIAACGKKEEPAPAPAPAQQAKPTEPEKPAEDKNKVEAAPTPAPTPAPEPAKAEAAATPTPAGAPPERARLQPKSVATLPEGVVAVAGTSSLSQLVNAFASQAGKIDGMELPPDPLAMAIEQAKKEAGIDLSWLDLDKPLRVAVPDPKKYQDGFVVVFPVKADAKVDVAGFFPGAVKDAEGHGAKVDMEGKSFYLDLVEGHVVVTSHAPLKGELESFLKDLTAWAPTEALVLDTSVENLRRVFADEMKGAREMVGMMTEQLAKDPSMGQQGAAMVEAADFGFALVEGATRMSLALDPTGDFPRLALSFAGQADSPIGKFAANTAGKKLSFASAVPNEAWLVLGYDIPNAGYLSDVDAIVDQIASQSDNPMAPKFNEEEKKELKVRLGKLVELQGTQSVTWLKQEGALPFIFESLSDSPDGAALATALIDFADFIYKKLWSQVRSQVIAQGAPASEAPENLDFKSFTSFFNKNAGQMGVGLDVREAKTKNGGAAQGVEIRIDWQRLPLAGAAAAVGKLVGDRIGFGFAGEGKHFAVAVGADPATRVAGILDRGVPETATDPWLAKSADNAFLFMMRPARLLNTLAGVVPELEAQKATFASLPDDPFLVTGASDGTTVTVELTLSAKHLNVFSMLAR